MKKTDADFQTMPEFKQHSSLLMNVNENEENKNKDLMDQQESKEKVIQYSESEFLRSEKFKQFQKLRQKQMSTLSRLKMMSKLSAIKRNSLSATIDLTQAPKR